MKFFVIRSLVRRLLVPLFLLAAGAAASAQDVVLELSMPQQDYRQGDSLSITYTVRNRESSPVSVLKWNTPLEGLIGNPFVVSQDGVERRFFGVMAMRMAPGPGDWITIPAKESVSVTVNLAEAYDVSAAGTYQVTIRHGFHHVASGAPPTLALHQLRRRPLVSNTVTFKMADAGQPRPLPPERPGKALTTPNYSSCSSSQQSSLGGAWTTMAGDASTASSTVGGWSCTSWGQSAAATTFMGQACTSSSLSAVQRVTGLVPQYAQGNVTIDCSGTNTCASPPSPCGQSNPNGTVVAFTCGSPTIYVCPNAFFNYPQAKAVPSQASILYHELTHWAGTLDYAYGCQNCVNLAKSDPAQAQNSADSYTYFSAYVVNGGTPSCGVENLAFSAFAALLVQWAGRRRLRNRALA